MGVVFRNSRRRATAQSMGNWLLGGSREDERKTDDDRSTERSTDSSPSLELPSQDSGVHTETKSGIPKAGALNQLSSPQDNLDVRQQQQQDCVLSPASLPHDSPVHERRSEQNVDLVTETGKAAGGVQSQTAQAEVDHEKGPCDPDIPKLSLASQPTSVTFNVLTSEQREDDLHNTADPCRSTNASLPALDQEEGGRRLGSKDSVGGSAGRDGAKPSSTKRTSRKKEQRHYRRQSKYTLFLRSLFCLN